MTMVDDGRKGRKFDQGEAEGYPLAWVNAGPNRPGLYGAKIATTPLDAVSNICTEENIYRAINWLGSTKVGMATVYGREGCVAAVGRANINRMACGMTEIPFIVLPPNVATDFPDLWGVAIGDKVMWFGRSVDRETSPKADEEKPREGFIIHTHLDPDRGNVVLSREPDGYVLHYRGKMVWASWREAVCDVPMLWNGRP